MAIFGDFFASSICSKPCAAHFRPAFSNTRSISCSISWLVILLHCIQRSVLVPLCITLHWKWRNHTSKSPCSFYTVSVLLFCSIVPRPSSYDRTAGEGPTSVHSALVRQQHSIASRTKDLEVTHGDGYVYRTYRDYRYHLTMMTFLYRRQTFSRLFLPIW